MTHDAEKIAAARKLWEDAQDAALAGSPLADMGRWLASGSPPPRAELRAWGFAGDRPPDRETSLVRGGFNRRWGFSIPCREAVDALRDLGEIVEVGAGTGYWSALLAKAGLPVVATDAAASGEAVYNFTVGRDFAVEPLAGPEAVARFAERTVFCSWPTRGDDWLVETLARLAQGRRVALIAEPHAGKTGSPALYDLLRTSFRGLSLVEIPQFPGHRDALVIFERL